MANVQYWITFIKLMDAALRHITDLIRTELNDLFRIVKIIVRDGKLQRARMFKIANENVIYVSLSPANRDFWHFNAIMFCKKPFTIETSLLQLFEATHDAWPSKLMQKHDEKYTIRYMAEESRLF